MSDYWILDGHAAVPVDDVREWARMFEGAARRVASDSVGVIRVSTVFLGIDHSFGDGPPLLFETMIFGGKHNDYQRRCSTWDEAEKQHAAALAVARTK